MTVVRYRKRPIVVEARQVPPSEDGQSGLDLAAWCGGSVSGTYAEPKIFVPTLEGELVARVGDWIVKGSHGEFWPVKGSIFAETYEPATEADSSFFQPGRTYAHSVYRFRCEHLAAHPVTGRVQAWGWFGKNDAWRHHSFNERQFQIREWVDVTEAGAS